MKLSFHSKWFTVLATTMAIGFSTLACDDEPSKNGTSDGGTLAPAEVAQTKADAKAAMQACNLSKASDLYEKLYAADANDAEIQLERAISGLSRLANDPGMIKILKAFGFENDDYSSLWGEKGIFAQITAGEDQDFAAVISDIKNPAFLNCNFDDEDEDRDKTLPNCKDFLEATLDKKLKASDISDTLVSLQPHFASLAVSFENAAKAAAGASVKAANGGCGLDKLDFSAGDLYFVAALLNLTAASIDLLNAYDTDIVIYDLIKAIEDIADWSDQDSEYADNATSEDDLKAKLGITDMLAQCEQSFSKVNAKIKTVLLDHLFKLKKGGSATKGREYMVKAASQIVAALAAPKSEKSFLGWGSLPKGMKSDITKIAQAIVDNTDGVFNLSIFTPTASGDLKKLFDTPREMGSAKLACDVEFYMHESYYCDNAESCYYGSAYLTTDYVADIVIRFLAESLQQITSDTQMITMETDCNELNSSYGDDSQYVNNALTCTSIDLNDTYSVKVADDWEDFDDEEFFDPNGYFYGEVESDYYYE